MTEKFVNRISTTLTGAMSASTPGASETWAVASVTGLPTTGEFRMVVVEPGTANTEIFKITSVNVGAVTVTGLRGQEGTPAAAHASGKTITMVVTAAGLVQLATDTLARIAATSPLSVSLNGSGDPTLAIQAADGSHNGYLASGDYTKLVGIATGAQVNVLESVSGTAPIVVAAVSAKNQAISIAAASGSAAGSQSAAHYTLLANATDIATGSAIAKRDSNGDITFRNVLSTLLSTTQDDNLAAQPLRLYGRQSGNDFLHTYNLANISVGKATALDTGSDRTKLDSLNQTGGGTTFDSTGLYMLLGYTLRGKRRWARTRAISTTGTVFQYADQDIATPENIDYTQLRWSVTVTGRNSYRYQANQQKYQNLDSPADNLHWSTIVSMNDNTTNLSTVASQFITCLIVEEL